ncbi:MAG: TlpA disulfide reductase family protein [Bacteroidota bacterium]|nr:TlpA disulfide reductase family protein [Bacteroidota bacterium]MDP4244001.1 TlpA disulfide reductase family protein [Bacteroidota bacterium]MDP4288167.1 TlpA disulfide reductase family protein [Bacteroidota bacterium]
MKTLFVPPVVAVDSNVPKYLHNVSQIKFWDRMSPANRATSFAWWDSTGQVHEMNEYYNKVVVLAFFGTWSSTSMAQLASIDTMLAAHDTNVLLIGVSMRERVLDGKAVILIDSFARARGIPYQILIGSRDFAFTYGGVDAVPTTFIISRKRKIAATLEGYTPAAILRREITNAEEMP